MANDMFQFGIVIHGIWPRIWRRIVVPSEFTFYEFHVAIQDAMGWKHRQPYMFHGFLKAKGLKIFRPQPFGQAPLSDIDYEIANFFSQPGDRTIYEYDSMEHMIELECIHQRDQIERPLMCLGGERACPPDGIGGAGHYEKHLTMMSDENHPQHYACRVWLRAVGGPFDPEYFDHNSVVFSNAQTRFRTPQHP